MVAYTRDEIISATDLARNVSATLNSLSNHEKEKIAISKNNKIETVMISIDEYERLKEADKIINGKNK
jgi:PHD/YefM family antitoxin component YafN of YafNO toxin-antitoxin module